MTILSRFETAHNISYKTQTRLEDASTIVGVLLMFTPMGEYKLARSLMDYQNLASSFRSLATSLRDVGTGHLKSAMGSLASAGITALGGMYGIKNDTELGGSYSEMKRALTTHDTQAFQATKSKLAETQSAMNKFHTNFQSDIEKAKTQISNAENNIASLQSEREELLASDAQRAKDKFTYDFLQGKYGSSSAIQPNDISVDPQLRQYAQDMESLKSKAAFGDEAARIKQQTEQAAAKTRIKNFQSLYRYDPGEMSTQTSDSIQKIDIKIKENYKTIEEQNAAMFSLTANTAHTAVELQKAQNEARRMFKAGKMLGVLDSEGEMNLASLSVGLKQTKIALVRIGASLSTNVNYNVYNTSAY